MRDIPNEEADPAGHGDIERTLSQVYTGVATSGDLARARGISQQAASASLSRCHKAHLVSRKDRWPFRYTLTKRGQDRLGWMRDSPTPATGGDWGLPPEDQAVLTYFKAVFLVSTGANTSTRLAAAAGVERKHAAASLFRCRGMGLLSRKPVGRGFTYALTGKGVRLVTRTAKFEGVIAQFQRDGITEIPAGGEANWAGVTFMAKLPDCPAGVDTLCLEIELWAEGSPRSTLLRSDLRGYACTVRVDSPTLAPGIYHGRHRILYQLGTDSCPSQEWGDGTAWFTVPG